MSKPVMKENVSSCKICGALDTVSLVCFTNTSFEQPTVTLCPCGNIEVVITLGQKVTVVRG